MSRPSLRLASFLFATIAAVIAGLALSLQSTEIHSDLILGVITALSSVLAAIILAVTTMRLHGSEYQHKPSEVSLDLTGEYLRKWINLESILRGMLIRATGDVSFEKAPLNKIINEYGSRWDVGDQEESELRSAVHLRNDIVHGAGAYAGSISALGADLNRLDGLIKVAGRRANTSRLKKKREVVLHSRNVENSYVAGESVQELADIPVTLAQDDVEGELAESEGDLPAIAGAYQQALNSQDRELAARALEYLGSMAERQGDLPAIAGAYQQALNSQDRELAAQALVRLGDIAERLGNLDAAVQAFQQVIDIGDVAAAPAAALNLGIALQQRGDVDAAIRALEQAIDKGNETVTRVARDLERSISRRKPIT
jgi:hypothetical protein